jgi:hypothetical protein
MTTIEQEVSTVTDREPTAAEIDAFRREAIFAHPDQLAPDEFPRLWNMSAGFAYRAVLRAADPEPPEFVTIPVRFGRSLETCGAMSQWNVLWEAAQFRRRMFDEKDLPVAMCTVADVGDVNVMFVPRTASRYFEYAPLYHLLPRATLERHGLPLLTKGQWPFITDNGGKDDYLPSDFSARLSNAWSAEVWRYLMGGARMRDFSATDPIKLLAHNLDFWLPAVNEVIQETLRDLPEIDKRAVDEVVRLVDGTVLDGASVANPRVGSDIWRGEDEARAALERTLEAADERGHLRDILDAVRSNRVEDDFAPHWSRAREDFERKLNHKRARVKVSFVEIPDTIPVHGPETAIVDNLVVGDFLALLDDKERKVVLLLRSGVTKLTDVARELGYSNHSAVSKRLGVIRRTAARYFDER